jgi:hypothetical protein
MSRKSLENPTTKNVRENTTFVKGIGTERRKQVGKD